MRQAHVARSSADFTADVRQMRRHYLRKYGTVSVTKISLQYQRLPRSALIDSQVREVEQLTDLIRMHPSCIGKG